VAGRKMFQKAGWPCAERNSATDVVSEWTLSSKNSDGANDVGEQFAVETDVRTGEMQWMLVALRGRCGAEPDLGLYDTPASLWLKVSTN